MNQPSVRRRPYGLTKPCATCPFRSDVRPFIRPERVREIERALVRSEFPCHNTTDHSDSSEEEGPYIPAGAEMHCAGALILLEKEERPSQMMRIAERLGMYDRRKLDMAAPVYDSFDEMFEAHVDAERSRRRLRRRSCKEESSVAETTDTTVSRKATRRSKTTKKPGKVPLPEIAKKISAHLRRFEADPSINKKRNGLQEYYLCHAFAGPRDRYVRVVYISFQGTSKLTREQAEAYLRWLDRGNVGRHREALRGL